MFYRKLLLMLSATVIVAVLSCAAGAGSDNPSPVPVPDPVAPDAPTGLDTDAITGATIKLTWSDNSDNEAGFTLQRAENSSFTGSTEIPITADNESYLDKALASGHTYYYRLRSFYGPLNSDWSNTAEKELVAITPPPAKPEIIAATAQSATSITITWEDKSDNEEGFILQRAVNSSFTGATEIPIPADEESYLDTSLATGFTYYYRIRSWYDTLLSDWSDTVDEELPVIVTIPAAPEGISATAQTTTSVSISWSDMSDNETGFLLQRAQNAAFTGAVSLPQSANTEAYTDNGCAANTNYWYRIRSENSAGSSSYIQTGPVKTPAAGSDTVIKVHFTDGVEHGGQKIYTIWLANGSENFYRNIFVCNRIRLQNLTGTGLPYWQENIRPHFTSSEIDAVSGATVATGNFTREITLDQNDPRQFTVYFEVDHSWDNNEWFGDQPAVTFAANIDLDNPQTTYTMHFIGWTPNENTDGGTPGGVYGVLNTVLKYILEKKDGTEEPEPATDLVGDLTVTIEQ